MKRLSLRKPSETREKRALLGVEAARVGKKRSSLPEYRGAPLVKKENASTINNIAASDYLRTTARRRPSGDNF